MTTFSEFKDYFIVLFECALASNECIKKLYRKLAIACHLDKAGSDSTEKFKALQSVFDDVSTCSGSGGSGGSGIPEPKSTKPCAPTNDVDLPLHEGYYTSLSEVLRCLFALIRNYRSNMPTCTYAMLSGYRNKGFMRSVHSALVLCSCYFSKKYLSCCMSYYLRQFADVREADLLLDQWTTKDKRRIRSWIKKNGCVQVDVCLHHPLGHPFDDTCKGDFISLCTEVFASDYTESDSVFISVTPLETRQTTKYVDFQSALGAIKAFKYGTLELMGCFAHPFHEDVFGRSV